VCALAREGNEAANDRAVSGVCHERRQRRDRSVVELHESRRLQERPVGGGALRGSHSRVDDRQYDVHQRDAGEQPVKETEQGPKGPAAVADRGEDAVIDEGEALTGDEVQDVAERLSRVRSPEKAVPSGKGRSIRVKPSSLAARRPVVRTTVPTKPPATAPQAFMRARPCLARQRRGSS
jgi:hypothetical protein